VRVTIRLRSTWGYVKWNVCKRKYAQECMVSLNYNLLWMSSHSLLSLQLNKHNSSQTALATEKRQNLLALIEFVARKAAKNNTSESKRQEWQKGSDTGSWVCICTHSSEFHILHILEGDGLYLFILSYICVKWFNACTDTENIFAFVLSSSSPSPPEQGNLYLSSQKLKLWTENLCPLSAL